MLTGKCKEDFEKWLENQIIDECNISDEYSFQPSYIGDFERLPLSMQYGVYVDFFDSVGIDVQVFWFENGNDIAYQCSVYLWELWECLKSYGTLLATRNEARQKAIEKANDIYNEITQAQHIRS